MVSEKLDLPGRRRLFQFTLGDLLVATVGVSVGLSVKTPDLPLWVAILAAVVFWSVLGLCNQIRDLWGTFHGRPELSLNQRWGWRFAMFWRACLAALLSGYYVLGQALKLELLSLPEWDFNYVQLGAVLPLSVVYLSLVALLASRPKRQKHPRQTRWSSFVEAGGFLLAVPIVFLLTTDSMLISLLVEVAIRCMGAAQPLRFFDADSAIYLADRSAFFWCSLIATTLLLAAFVLVRRLAQAWASGKRPRLFREGLLWLAVPLATLYPLWLAATGFAHISPCFAQCIGLWPPFHWMMAAILFLLAVTLLARRMVSVSEPQFAPGVFWRKHPRGYYHERAPFLACLVMATILHLVPPDEPLGDFWAWASMLENPFTYLILAVLLLALGGLIDSFRSAADVACANEIELPLAPFCITWIAMLLLALAAIVTLAALGFAAWLSPWYLDCWP